MPVLQARSEQGVRPGGIMQRNFEQEINGQLIQFTARTGTAHDVAIFESGAVSPCVVLTSDHGLERALGALVDKDELLSIAITQTLNHGLIARARQSRQTIHESLVFVPNPD